MKLSKNPKRSQSKKQSNGWHHWNSNRGSFVCRQSSLCYRHWLITAKTTATATVVIEMESNESRDWRRPPLAICCPSQQLTNLGALLWWRDHLVLASLFNAPLPFSALFNSRLISSPDWFASSSSSRPFWLFFLSFFLFIHFFFKFHFIQFRSIHSLIHFNSWLDWIGFNLIGLDWIGLHYITLDLIWLGWVGLDWIGLDWIGLDLIGFDWVWLGWVGLDLIGLDWIEFDWIGFDLNGLDLIELDWIGLDWIGFNLNGLN